jgi:hypothetical protein
MYATTTTTSKTVTKQQQQQVLNSLAFISIPFTLVRAEEKFSIEKLDSDDSKNELKRKMNSFFVSFIAKVSLMFADS